MEVRSRWFKETVCQGRLEICKMRGGLRPAGALTFWGRVNIRPVVP